MRHFLLPGAIAAHALGMGEPPAATTLVASPRFPNRSKPNQLRTGAGTIALASVAVAANEHLRSAAPTQKESTHHFHRLALHWAEQLSTGRGYPWNNHPAHVFGTLWGTTSGKLGGLLRCRACSVRQRHFYRMLYRAVIPWARENSNLAVTKVRNIECVQRSEWAFRYRGCNFEDR